MRLKNPNKKSEQNASTKLLRKISRNKAKKTSHDDLYLAFLMGYSSEKNIFFHLKDFVRILNETIILDISLKASPWEAVGETYYDRITDKIYLLKHYAVTLVTT